MKRRHPYGAFAVQWAVLSILVTAGFAQQATNPFRIGVPQDWTQHHLVFSSDSLQRHPELANQEPRVVFNGLQRWQIGRANLNNSSIAAAPAPQRDWNVTLGNRLAANMFPAKYSFDPSQAPSCTNDYVAFALNVAGITNGRANLVGFNNLYVGPGGFCGTGPQPNTLFAYNVSTIAAGRIATSPVLSADGQKIALVETGSGSAVFHVVTWAAGAGTITHSVVPASMTTLTYSNAAPNTRSSPWVDYASDVAYVGADDGNLYKITGVFKGTPALAGGVWPVAVSPGTRLTAPVLDNRLGLVMVGSQNGTLYSVDTASGTVKSLVIGRSGARNPGILAPPIVDVGNGTTFVVSSNNGTSAVFVQVDTATMTVMRSNAIGIGSKSGTTINLYEPAFSNSYFTNPATGLTRLCGTGTGADISPWQYAFGFTLTGGRYVMNAAPASSSQLVNSQNARCTGWTEFFNPNVGAGGTDFFFFGLTADCTGTGTSGCVIARNADGSLTIANVAGGPSGIVVDNFRPEGQASSIYFMGLAAPNTAYKFTQNGLQ